MTIKTVWLHIGTEKTGSTAIQRFLFDNRGRLKDRGYHLLSSRYNHHGPIRNDLASLKTDLIDKAIQEIRASSSADFLFTYEGLYSLLPRSLAMLMKKLASFRVIPVLYLRRRSDKLRSNFAQRVKMGTAVEEYGRQLLTQDFLERHMGLDYLGIINKWDRILTGQGQGGNLQVRIYERGTLVNNDVVDDFLHAIRVLSQGESVAKSNYIKPGRDANISIGPAAQYVMVLLRAFGLDERAQRHVLEVLWEHDHGNDRNQSVVPDEMCTDLDERYSADDTIIARRFFNRDQLFHEPPSFTFEPPSGDRFIELIQTICQNAGASTKE